MTENRELKVEELEKILGGEDGSSSTICCPYCKQALPAGSGGVYGLDEKGNAIVMFRCKNSSCEVDTFELFYSDLTSTGRAWNAKGQQIYKNGRRINI